jgi:hypothetical protein
MSATTATRDPTADVGPPPQDLEIEEALVGGMLLPGAPTAEVRALVSASDLYRPAYGNAFAAICDLADRAAPIDALLVGRELGLDNAGVGELIAATAAAPAPSSLPTYARIVAEKAKDRRTLALLVELEKATREGRRSEVLPGAIQSLGELSSSRTELLIEDAADVMARVSSAGEVHWLASPVWPADAYGVLAAEKKVGKTWLALDLAVAVASGGAWLGAYPVETPGPVLVFLGEGGERKMVRRLQAICAAKGVRLAELRIRLCHRAPSLASSDHLEEIRREVRRTAPALVIVDPLYLSATGAKSADLYAMGAVLAGIQSVCQEAGAALLIVTHWNKTGEGHGAHRMTGAGPAEWGRVLVSVGKEHLATEKDRSTVATLRLTFEGDEIPETELRLCRRIWADNPDDLASALHYELEVLTGPEAEGEAKEMRPADRRVLAVLRAADDWLDVKEIGDRLAADESGFAPLKTRTIQASCKALVGAGYARAAGMGPTAHKWRAQLPEIEAENAF